MIGDRLQSKLKEVDDFQQKVMNEGANLFKEILNNDWFDIVRAGVKKVWGGTGKEPLNCKYVPYRWLVEQDEWNRINPGLIDLEQFTSKKQYLRKKVVDLISDDWMVASAAAFELSALIKFKADGVLKDIDPKIIEGKESRADALIKVNDRDILVELTTITKEVVTHYSDSVEVFTIPVERLVYQVVSKIKGKAETQLSIAEKPVILIISLPQGIGVDQLTARWAVEENITNYSKISSIIISDSYRFKYGAWYFNGNAEFELNEEEKTYISNLLLLNTSLAKKS